MEFKLTPSGKSSRASSVLGSLLVEFPEKLPETIGKLIEHAPESFDDLRYGLVAVAIRATAFKGQPVHVLSVRDNLDSRVDAQLLNDLTLSALPLDLAEYESAGLWQDYMFRRSRSLLSDALRVIESKTTTSNNVLKHVGAEIERLSADNEENNLEARLEGRVFDFHREPPALVPVFSLCGSPVCTAGNLTSIVSQAKTGKSAVVGAMIAATFAKDEADLLGFQSQNGSGLAVVHFDTEQSPHDAWHVVARAVRRSGASEPPPWLRSYCLTGLLPGDAWQAVREGVRLAAVKFKGIHSVLIDGVGDLVHDVNDAGECTDFVASLHGLAIEYNCPIIGVLHFNPDSAKARGHLGSQLERKSESNLRLDKEEDSTVLWSNKQRRASIAKDFGPRFKWNKETGMHTTIVSRSEARLSAKAEALIPGRDDAFFGRQSMRWNEMISAIETTDKCVRRTAERRIADWKKFGLIEQSVAGLWIPKG